MRDVGVHGDGIQCGNAMCSVPLLVPGDVDEARAPDDDDDDDDDGDFSSFSQAPTETNRKRRLIKTFDMI